MKILFFYIFRRFWWNFFAFSLGFMLLIFLIDFIETSYQLSKRLEFSAVDFVQISLLKMPELYTEILPFLVLFTAVAVYRRFILDSEIDVFRSAGISAWQFLSPAVIGAGIIGMVNLLLLSTIAIKTTTMAEAMKDQLEYKSNSNIVQQQVISWRTWLHDVIDGESYIFDIINISPTAADLSRLKIQVMDIRVQNSDGKLQRQIKANNIDINSSNWLLPNAVIIDYVKGEQRKVENYVLSTNFTPSKLVQNALPADFLNFFQLVDAIKTGKENGAKITPYLLHALSKLSEVVLFVSLASIGGTLALRHRRRGGGMWVLAMSVGAGFAVWVLSEVILTLGIEEKIPVLAASLLPALLASFVALLLILYREEG